MKRLLSALLVFLLLINTTLCTQRVYADEDVNIETDTIESDSSSDASSVEQSAEYSNIDQSSLEVISETDEIPEDDNLPVSDETDFVLSDSISAEDDLDEVDLSLQTDDPETVDVSIAQVNSLYSDSISEDDLVKSDEINDISVASSEQIYSDPVSAGTYIREAMKQRDGSVAFTYLTDKSINEDNANAVIREICDEMFGEALTHTGVPTEGDYLAFQYGGYRADHISISVVSGKTSLGFDFAITYYDSHEQEQELDRRVDEVINSLNLDGKSQYEKVKAVYDYVCSNVVYDHANLDDDTYILKYTAYAALVNGTAVCQGYSNLLYRLLLAAGIDARIISGTGHNEAHAWNIVRIKNLYYNVDSTWDAPRKADNYPYAYFLTNNDNFLNHTRDSEYDTEEFNRLYPMSAEDYDADNDDSVDRAYAVLTGNGELIFLRSYESHEDKTTGTIQDINNNDYSGTIYSNIEGDNAGVPWSDKKMQIIKVRVAQGQKIAPKTMDSWFNGCTKLTDFSSDGFETSSVIDMGNLFRGCSKLKNIDLSSFDTSNVTSMSYLFYNCSSLTDLDISGFNTGKVTTMNQMFSGCSSLSAVRLGNGFSKWISNSYLSSGYWRNYDLSITKSGSDLYKEYPSHASEWTGTWKSIVPVSSIILVTQAVSLKAGDVYDLSATVQPENASVKSIKWSSDNETVAKVDTNGKVTAISAGKATITATSTDGLGVSANCQINVLNADSYKVTLHAGDGSFVVDGVSSKVFEFYVEKGAYITGVQNPTIEGTGLVFDAWYSDADLKTYYGEYLNYTKTDHDLELYAAYCKQYTVTFDMNGGYYSYGIEDSPTYTSLIRDNGRDSLYFDSNSAVHDGAYALKGWMSEEGDFIDKGSIRDYHPAKDTTLVAQWDEAYIITLICDEHGYYEWNNGYTREKTVKVLKGESVGMSHSPTLVNYQEEYSFDAYYTEQEYINKITSLYSYVPTSDIVLYGRFLEKVKITLDGNGGYFSNDPSQTTYQFGSQMIGTTLSYISVKPSREGFAFAGWALKKDAIEAKQPFSVILEGDITIYAVWKEGIKVTLHSMEGQFSDGTNKKELYIVNGYTIADSYSIDINPYKTGFAFDGWYGNAGLSEDSLYPSNINRYLFTEDIDLYAGYRETCEYTFDANGGYFGYSQSNTKNVLEMKIGSLYKGTPYISNPTYDGKVFDGWYTDPECTGEEERFIDHLVESPKTYYAKWSEDNRTVTYHGNGGLYNGKSEYVMTYKKNQMVKPGVNPQSFIRNGYLPIGLFLDPECTQKVTKEYGFRITDNIDYYIGWTDEIINITFNPNGGYISLGSNLNYKIIKGSPIRDAQNLGTRIISAKSTKKEAFNGWVSDIDGYIGDENDLKEYVPTKDVVISPQWTNKYHTVNVHAGEGVIYRTINGNSVQESDFPLYIADGFACYENNPSYSNRRFLGWYADEGLTEFVCDVLYNYVPSSDIDLYAKYADRDNVGLVIDLDGGYYLENGQKCFANYSSSISYGAPLNETLSYLKTIISWKDDSKALVGFAYERNGQPITGNIKLEEDLKLYAVYSDSVYKIKLDFNGGSYDNESYKVLSIPKGRSLTYSVYPTHPEGFLFSGFYFDKEKTEKVSDYYVPSKDMTLYAGWEDGYAVLRFVVNGGKAIYYTGGDLTDQFYLTKNSEINLDNYSAVSDSGLGFVGWYDNPEFSGEPLVYMLKMTKDITLYAKFADHYVVTLDANGKTFSNDKTSFELNVDPGKALKDYPDQVPFLSKDGQFKIRYWDSKEDGTGKYVSKYKIIDSDMHLYAQWYKPVKSLKITGGVSQITIGESVSLSTLIEPSDATYQTVLWESSDVNVASVNSEGKVIGLKAGTVKISARNTMDDISDEIVLTVKGPSYTVRFDSTGGSSVSSQTVEEGKKAIRPSDPTRTNYMFDDWYLDDKKYDFNTPVMSDIVLKAKWNAIKVTSLTLDTSELTLQKGNTYSLIASVLPNNATNKTLKWVSSDSNVATVSSNGLVTAIGEGEANITVSTTDGSGLSKTCRVTVTYLDNRDVMIEPKEMQLNIGETGQFTTFVDGEKNTEEVVFESLDDSIASIDQNGLAKGLKTGTTTIVAVLKNNYDAFNSMKQTAANAQSHYNESVQAEIDAEKDLIQKQSAYEDLNKECEDLLAEKTEVEGAIKEMEDKIDEVNLELNAIQNKLDNANEELVPLEEAYNKAKEEYKKAQEFAKNAKAIRAKGSIGFFEDRGSTDAVEIINSRIEEQKSDTTWGKTEIGVSGDATSLENMKKALQYIVEGNKLRRNDNNHTGLSDLQVSDVLMAISQVQGNASATNTNHSLFYRVNENLAWISRTPYDLWYTDEKLVYDYIAKNGGTIQEAVAYLNSHGYPNLRADSTGHYENIINTDVLITGFAVVSKANGYYTCEQSFLYYNLLGDHVNSVEDYIKELDAYIDKLDNASKYVAEKKKEMDNAKNAYDRKVSEINEIKSTLLNVKQKVKTQEELLSQKTAELNSIIEELNALEVKKNEAYIEYQNANSVLTSARAATIEAEKQLSEALNDLSQLSVQATVEVVNLIKSIKLNKTKIMLNKGQEERLQVTVTPENATNKIISFSSSDPSVATVSETGNIKAIGEGTAKIIARTTDGSDLSATCTVTVKDVSFHILKVSPIAVKKSTKLSVDDPSIKVSWSSSDTSIASIASDGTLKALKPGLVDITATDNETGYFDTIEVRVLFSDVTDPSQFYYEYVYSMSDRGIVNGWDDGTFRPNELCNRAAIITFLWKMAGRPMPEKQATFRDMTDDADFNNAISWGVENGIVTGWTEDNTFRPWDKCNRAAIITFLWRYAGRPTPKARASFKDMTGNADFDNAISWGVENGITTGWDDNTFRPWDKCKRLAAVSFLGRSEALDE